MRSGSERPASSGTASAKWGVHILHIEIVFTYFAYFAYYFAYFAYWRQYTTISSKPAYCMHILHIFLHIFLHILHIEFSCIFCILYI